MCWIGPKFGRSLYQLHEKPSVCQSWGYAPSNDTCTGGIRAWFQHVCSFGPQKSSHNYSGTVLGRIMDLGQKLRKMWSAIAPSHGFAIEAEAIFPRRGAYISIRPKKSVCCEDSHKTLRGGSMPPEVPLIGTPGWTREVVYRKLPNMHTLFGDSIFPRSKQEHVLKRDLARQQCLGQEPDFALAYSGNRWRARNRGNREIKKLTTSATSVPGISPQGRATAAVRA